MSSRKGADPSRGRCCALTCHDSLPWAHLVDLGTLSVGGTSHLLLLPGAHSPVNPGCPQLRPAPPRAWAALSPRGALPFPLTSGASPSFSDLSSPLGGAAQLLTPLRLSLFLSLLSRLSHKFQMRQHTLHKSSVLPCARRREACPGLCSCSNTSPTRKLTNEHTDLARVISTGGKRQVGGRP